MHAQVQQCASPQQRNGYDYEMHVLVSAQNLADWTTVTNSLVGDSSMILTNTKTTLHQD
jgi:hypothetical protein